MYNNDFRDTSSSERQKIVSARSYSRVVPSTMLQPYLSVAPVQTKFSVLPLIDPRKQVTTQLEQLPTYNIHNTFNPGNAQAPWSGFASNINKESELRNQIYALQKCSQSVYVPNSNSDLYEFGFKSEKNNAQPFPGLFENERFEAFNPNPENLGNITFYNCTRNQLKNLGDKDKSSCK